MTRILVVDDKEENLYLLQAMLTGNGLALESVHADGQVIDETECRPEQELA